jgi:predicted DNA-binding protein
MDALNYEYLIRRCHQVGRYGVAGADADTFREFERSYILVTSEKDLAAKGQPKQWNKTIEELNIDYATNAGKVSAYINTAIEKAMKDYEDKLSDEQYEVLEQCKIQLISPTYDKICNVIKQAEETLVAIGVFPQ